MADSKENKSRRDAQVERLRNKYPDKSFEDDEEIFAQISDDYDDYDRRLSEYDERERKLSDFYFSDPRAARLMTEWSNGDDPAISLLRILGKDDLLAALDDPEKQEEIRKANKEFAEKVKKEAEYEDTYNNNLQQSLADLEALASSEGLSDDDIDSAMESLIEICRDFILGKFTPDTVRMILKAKNHDEDVRNAREEGEIAGKNQKVSEKLRKAKDGDGTIPLQGKPGASPAPKKGMSVFDLARMA